MASYLLDIPFTKLIFIDPVVKIKPEHASAATSFLLPAIRWVAGTFFTFQRDSAPAGWLTVLAKQLHCCWQRHQTLSGYSTSHQTAWISLQLTTQSGAFGKSKCTRTVARYVWCWPLWRRLIHRGHHFDQHIMTEQSISADSICITVSEKGGHFWTSYLKTVIVRLRTSCYWIVVQSYVYVILFIVRFLNNTKTNFPETLRYCLQYIHVCMVMCS